MSKIRLHGSSSGYTEIAPVAASGNNTLTLPNDGTIISQDSNGAVGVTSITVGTGVTIGDGRVTCATLHGSAANCTQIPAANIVGVCTSGFERTGGFGGITEADQWRVTSDFTMNSASAANISSNWERNDTTFEKIGDGMSVDGSTGHFTFPSTGKWLIQMNWIAERSSGASHWGIVYCYGMTDGVQSNGFEIMQTYCGVAGNSGRQSGSMQVIFDVQNTSGYKVFFGYYDNNVQTTVFRGSSSSCENAFTFIRLGDT